MICDKDWPVSRREFPRPPTRLTWIMDVTFAVLREHEKAEKPEQKEAE